MAVSRFDARKQLVIEEANAIGTAALRTELLPQPFAAESAALFREYVAGRLRWSEAARGAPIQAEQARADVALHARLWRLAIASAEVRRDDQHAIYIEALNAVIDIHAERTNLRSNRVPDAVLVLLAIIAALAVGVAGGVQGRSGSSSARDLHALTFAVWLVIALIVDLDQPRRGFIQVSQAPLAQLADALGAR